jgi:hypothetical protein
MLTTRGTCFPTLHVHLHNYHRRRRNRRQRSLMRSGGVATVPVTSHILIGEHNPSARSMLRGKAIVISRPSPSPRPPGPNRYGYWLIYSTVHTLCTSRAELVNKAELGGRSELRLKSNRTDHPLLACQQIKRSCCWQLTTYGVVPVPEQRRYCIGPTSSCAALVSNTRTW